MRTEVKTFVSVLVLEVELKLSSISGVTRGHHALKQYGTGAPTMSYDWNNIVFIFKNLLESLDRRLFLLSKFWKTFKRLGVIKHCIP
jgi:hypothetical protein